MEAPVYVNECHENLGSTSQPVPIRSQSRAADDFDAPGRGPAPCDACISVSTADRSFAQRVGETSSVMTPRVLAPPTAEGRRSSSIRSSGRSWRLVAFLDDGHAISIREREGCPSLHVRASLEV